MNYYTLQHTLYNIQQEYKYMCTDRSKALLQVLVSGGVKMICKFFLFGFAVKEQKKCQIIAK